MNAPDRNLPSSENAPPEPAGAASGRSRTSADGRVARGLDTRSRLLEVALRLFAEKGYAQTSTREVCVAAGVNPASIHYYFGDKAGLYRAVYLEPIQQLMVAALDVASAGEAFEATMRRTYDAFLAPLKQSDEKTIQILKLHFREQAEPTGLVGKEVVSVATAHFDAIVAMLGRELGVAGADDDLQRLATCLIALAVDFLTRADWIRRIAPRLHAGPEAIDRMAQRLTVYAVAMLAGERQRRAEAPEAGAGAAPRAGPAKDPTDGRASTDGRT